MLEFFKKNLKKTQPKPKFYLIPLGIVVLLALFLRLCQINQLRLTHDEMSIGYNAYSILKTGRDEWGVRFPLVFKAFGDNKLPTYIYATVPSVAIFGLNGLAVKLPSVIAGLVVVIGMFYLVKLLLDDWKLGLLASFLVAINPWPLHLSRMGFESNIALALFILGLFYWIKIEKQPFVNWKKTLTTALIPMTLFALSTYTYIAYRLYIPMLLMVAIATSLWQQKRLGPIKLAGFLKSHRPTPTLSWKMPLLILVGVMILALPFFVSSGKSSNTSRFDQLFLNQNQGALSISTEQNNFCFLVEPHYLPYLCRRLYSPRVAILREVATNYLSFLTPSFSFIKGDKLEYLSLPGSPDIFTILLPFYWLGTIIWLQKKHQHFPIVTWAWLLAPIPSALSGSPQIVRGSALIPFDFLFITVGLSFVWRKLTWQQLNGVKRKLTQQQILTWSTLKRGLIFSSFFLVLTISALHFFTQYYLTYPRQYRSHFYPMGPDVARYVLDSQNQFENIYITDDFADAHILLAFYGKIDPAWYQQNVIRPQADKYNFQHPTRLGKFQFGQRLGNVIKNKTLQHWLYVTGPTDDTAYTKVFSGFSGVHKEVKVVDLDLARKHTTSKQQK